MESHDLSRWGLEWLPIVRKKYEALAERVAQDMRDLGEENKTSPYEVLKDPWEEFAFQIQEEESYLYEAYELTIFQFATSRIKELNGQNLVLLWAATSDTTGEGREIPCRAEMEEAIQQELFEYVSSLAGYENLDHYYEWRGKQEYGGDEDEEDEDEEDEDEEDEDEEDEDEEDEDEEDDDVENSEDEDAEPEEYSDTADENRLSAGDEAEAAVESKTFPPMNATETLVSTKHASLLSQEPQPGLFD